MEYKDIINLIRLVNKSDLAEVKLREGDFELSIRTEKYVKNSGKDASTGQPVYSVPQPHIMPPASVPQPAATPASTHSDSTEEAEPAAAQETSNSEYLEIKSPIVGTFYRSPAPDKPPYIKVGDAINVGDVVCIVEAMKLFNEIESEVSGRVVKVVTDDATPVEYDQVLFIVDPNG